MSKSDKLARTELEIMSGVWQFEKPFTVRELHEHLYPNKEKAFTTLQTMLGILYRKGFLTRQKIGQTYLYSPRISSEEFAKYATRNLISRIFHDSFGAFANFLVNSGEISREELAQLRHMIDEKEQAGRKES